MWLTRTEQSISGTHATRSWVLHIAVSFAFDDRAIEVDDKGASHLVLPGWFRLAVASVLLGAILVFSLY
jgi:hypothetical protein